MPYLEVTESPMGRQRGAIFPIVEGDNQIGRERDGSNCSIQLSDRKCSRLHAVIYHTAEDLRAIITHKSSTNSTLVNRVPLKGNQDLDDNDTIKIGDTHLLFFIGDPPAGLAHGGY